MIKALVALGFLLLNFYIYHFFASEEVVPERIPFAAFPLELEEWRCTAPERMEEKIERNLGVSDYLLCHYRRGETGAGAVVYVGYHATQMRREGGGSNENSIHPPKHCLPGSGWDIIAHEKVELDIPGLPGRPAPVNRLVVAKGKARQLVYYWYQSRGRVVADDWRKIVLMSWDRARLRRTDGSLVRFTMPLFRDDMERAEARFQELAALVVPELPKYVPE